MLRQKARAEAEADPESHKEGRIERKLLNNLERVVNRTPDNMKHMVGQNFLAGTRDPMIKRYHKEVREGREPTVAALMKGVTTSDRFLELCGRLGLSKEDFEKQAASIVEAGGK